MKQFTILDGKALVVELPKNLKGTLELKHTNPRMDGRGPVYLVEKMAGATKYITYIGEERDRWQILGRLSELTEDQAAGLVEYEKHSGLSRPEIRHVLHYKDYVIIRRMAEETHNSEEYR